MLARKAEAREFLGAGEGAVEAGLAGGEAPQRLEGAEQLLHGHPDARPGTRVRPDVVGDPRDA
jgi:hypothetical protein